jgi:hypothetical protein
LSDGGEDDRRRGDGKIEAVVFSNTEDVEPYLVRQNSRFDCFVDTVTGIHLNARFGVRDEIGERIETEFQNCLAFCSLKESQYRILDVAKRSS